MLQHLQQITRQAQLTHFSNSANAAELSFSAELTQLHSTSHSWVDAPHNNVSVCLYFGPSNNMKSLKVTVWKVTKSFFQGRNPYEKFFEKYKN